jgi:hypothetical protein
MQLSSQSKYSELDYILYLNNLFTSKTLIKALREHSIKTIRITRKYTKNIPRELFELK